MPVRKLAISLEEQLADDVLEAADRHADGNVSVWFAEAARQRLRQLALAEAILAHEAEHGAIGSDELEEVRREWPPG